MGKTHHSNWFHCFRRSPTIEIDTAVECSANRVLRYIAAVKKKSKQMKRDNNKNKMMRLKSDDSSPSLNSSRTRRRVKSSASDSQICHNDDDDDDELNNHDDMRNFSGFMKSAFSGTAMRTEVPGTKFQQNCSKRLDCTDQSSNSQQKKNSDEEFSTQVVETNQSTTTPDNLLPSSAANIQQTDLSYGKTPPKQSGNKRTEKQQQQQQQLLLSDIRINHVLCLVLFSLWMTVFWGKILAVMTTTVGIYVWEKKRTRNQHSLVLVNNNNCSVKSGCRMEITDLTHHYHKLNTPIARR